MAESLADVNIIGELVGATADSITIKLHKEIKDPVSGAYRNIESDVVIKIGASVRKYHEPDKLNPHKGWIYRVKAECWGNQLISTHKARAFFAKPKSEDNRAAQSAPQGAPAQSPSYEDDNLPPF